MKNDKSKTLQEERQRQRADSGMAAETNSIDLSLPGASEIAPLTPPDTEAERRLLEQQQEAAREAAQQRIDQTVEEGTAALQRAEEDAQAGFQAERDRIDIEEQQALDHQALYAEMRGDRGGIGQAQYAAIQSSAAVNRRQVNLEQQRLATETARQIEDLRRQGEFQKADALLQLTQQYLSELMELERWAKEQGLSVEKFNIELARWKAEYAWQVQRFGIETELKLGTLTGGGAKGGSSYSARQDERKKMAEIAEKMKELGMTLTPELAEALGWTMGRFESFIQGLGSQGGEQTGAPFQLVESWLSALRQSEDPAETYRQIRASEWYAKLTAEQRSRIKAAVAAALSQLG